MPDPRIGIDRLSYVAGSRRGSRRSNGVRTQQTRDEALGVERLELVNVLARADEHDRTLGGSDTARRTLMDE
jgi:hypothetical protein